jgi:hypothetical protein
MPVRAGDLTQSFDQHYFEKSGWEGPGSVVVRAHRLLLRIENRCAGVDSVCVFTRMEVQAGPDD